MDLFTSYWNRPSEVNDKNRTMYFEAIVLIQMRDNDGQDHGDYSGDGGKMNRYCSCIRDTIS